MEDKPIYQLNYLGKVYNTSIRMELTDKEYQAVVDGIRKKPDIKEVIDQIQAFAQGNTQMGKIYSYFFKETAYKVKVLYNRWSIDEALRHKPLMEFFAGKSAENKLVFPDDWELYQKIEKAFQLCGSGICSKPANFPIRTIDELLETYCGEGKNYYDFSCGWGARMLSAKKHKVNYFGTDPNTELYQELKECSALYDKVIYDDNALLSFLDYERPTTDIRCIGSENLQQDWIDKMDFAFTSPPYFSLEDYRIGDGQSYKEGTDYNDWLNNYARPTIQNCFKYLKKGGIFGYNIKNNFNYIKYDMEKDWYNIAIESGFKFKENKRLKNIARCYGVKGEDEDADVHLADTDENIKIFIKE